MYQYEKIPRTPLEGSAPTEGNATLVFDDFSCTNVKVLSEDGASGIVYEAVSEDFYQAEGMPPAHLIVKECYPVEIAEKLIRAGNTLSLSPDADKNDEACLNRFIKQYKEAFIAHAALYQSPAREQIVVPDKAHSLNGTEYLISDASNGDMMALAFEKMDLADQIKALIRVCEAIVAIHEAGYVYLDLKPDNILCIRNSDTSSNRRYTGEIKLFDFDTATKISALSQADTLISGSGGWSAHEQTHQGYRDKIGPKSDIYAIGSLLFWMVVGRSPKSNEVIHANGKWSISGRDCSNAELNTADERVFRCIRRILNSTLTIDPDLRYPTTKPLIDDLSTLCELVMPVGPIHATDHMAMMEKLDGLTALVSRLGAQSTRTKKAIVPEPTPEDIEADPSSVDNEVGFNPSASIEANESKPSTKRRNPAMAGYEAFQMLTLLAKDFKEQHQDDVRAALKTTAAEVKEVLASRNADQAESLFETATEMANSAMQLLMARQAFRGLRVPDKAFRVFNDAASALSRAIVDKDADEMFWHRAEIELCKEAFLPLAKAEAVKEHLGEQLSDNYFATLGEAEDKVISALEEADAEKLDSAIKGVKKTLKRAEDDAIAGMIAKSLS